MFNFKKNYCPKIPSVEFYTKNKTKPNQTLGQDPIHYHCLHLVVKSL